MTAKRCVVHSNNVLVNVIYTYFVQTCQLSYATHKILILSLFFFRPLINEYTFNEIIHDLDVLKQRIKVITYSRLDFYKIHLLMITV